jgi:cellulose synthase/poly-beta-1,6-N-acetylglucosamine synthase-like glycosyltransferase
VTLPPEGAYRPERERLPVTVLVTLYEDPRFVRAAGSLLEGKRVPDEILVADGGSSDGSWEQAQDLEADHDPVRAIRCPGSVAETRNQALPEAQGDVVAFLDADEVAPTRWLNRIVAPIESGEADFTGGPTRPWAPPESRAEDWVNRFDRWFYDHVVPQNIAALPMGNSAWRAALLEEVGGFDPRIRWGGEDYDLNLRALAAGARGRFLREAWVYHDQSHLDSVPALVRRKFDYSKGATVAYLKNDVLGDRATSSVLAELNFRHPLVLLFLLVKPLAFLAGYRAWRRIQD